MLPKEFLHIALEEEIEIEPLKDIPVINLIEYSYGPFSILQKNCKIPIFAALSLQKSGYCRIKCPNYLSQDVIENSLDLETDLKNEFTQIYPYIFEINSILIDVCYDIDDKNILKSKINEIYNLRQKKIVEGLKFVDSNALKITNLTGYEFCKVKNFILNTMKIAKRLEKI